jgi:hypothetical protein
MSHAPRNSGEQSGTDNPPYRMQVVHSLPLAQKQVHDPTAPDMLARPAAVVKVNSSRRPIFAIGRQSGAEGVAGPVGSVGSGFVVVSGQAKMRKT